MASSVARPACTICCGNGHFCVLCVTFLYIFPQPHFDLEPDYNSESQRNRDSNCILFVQKYCQLFTHESNTFTLFYTFTPMGTLMLKNPLNSPFPLRHLDTHLMHQCQGPPHSPNQTTARSLEAPPHS